ncbi:hypothetical protein MUK42_34583 [Musa troglodytarum]|uniref:Uncharacterized protein n=1 Tax=Musa troglodytarum TaxID=320322 RepID=A0A9E7JT19_9LILI|nr:hypothetical protein MUK42_34583 [Musa troglodytarum]
MPCESIIGFLTLLNFYGWRPCNPKKRRESTKRKASSMGILSCNGGDGSVPGHQPITPHHLIPSCLLSGV